MTLLIFSTTPNNPDPVESTTQKTLAQLFPDQRVTFSASLDTRDIHSDTPFTVVMPGGLLISQIEAFIRKPKLRTDLTENLDTGGHYIGFCAGAFFGSEGYLAGLAGLDAHYNDHSADFQEYDMSPLNMIPGSVALGPFKPYQSALLRNQNASLGTQFHYHAVDIKTEQKRFSSLYMEGPTFLDLSKTEPYAQPETVVASYVLDYELKVSIRDCGSKNPDEPLRDVTVGSTPPAALHINEGRSHRFLIGFHPELAANARTFLPAFAVAGENSGSIIKTMPMTEGDRASVLEAQQHNLDYLTGLFSKIRL